MSRPEYDKEFEEQHHDLIALLEHPSERERNWALARLEDAMTGCYVPGFLIKKILGIAKDDPSPLVRAQALRCLHHEPSECWPIDAEDRELLFRELHSEEIGRGIGGFPGLIQFEIMEIEKKINWLRPERDY